MSEFTYVEDQGSSASVKPRIRKIQFGDGYSQRSADGINNDLKTFKLAFTLLDATTYNAILSFFETRGGTTPFTWTPHGRTEGYYVCEEWEESFDYTGSISATFIEVMA
jgi:phage-related protein